MQDLGIVLDMTERPVYHVDSGEVLKSLMAVTLYQRPHQVFVLTREISMPNAINVTVSYMVIPGTTIKECSENMAKMSSMILNPVNLRQKNGPDKS